MSLNLTPAYPSLRLHNARTICADLKLHGPAVFDRFNGGLEGTLWYYESLLDVFRWRMPSPLTGELAGAVGRCAFWHATIPHQTGA